MGLQLYVLIHIPLQHQDKSLVQDIAFLLVDPTTIQTSTKCHLSIIEVNTYFGITLIKDFYVKGT